MRNKVSLGAALLLLLVVPAAGARDFTEGEFLAVGEKLVQSMKTLDFEGFMSVVGDDDGERPSETEWREQIRTVRTMVGELGEVTVDELDPPDGAYLTFNAAEGALDVFMILDAAGKVDEIRVSPKGQGHAGCGTP